MHWARRSAGAYGRLPSSNLFGRQGGYARRSAATWVRFSATPQNTRARERIDLSSFVAVAKTSDVTDPSSVLVEVGERLVVLVNAAGHWYALDDVCTHDGGPLSEGLVDPETPIIACPRHGAKFDLATGAAVTMPATQPTVAHEVRIDGDQVLVRLTDA